MKNIICNSLLTKPLFLLLLVLCMSQGSKAIDLTVNPGELPEKLKNISDNESEVILRGVALAADLEALRNIPAAVRRVDMSNLSVTGGRNASVRTAPDALYSEGELIPYLFFGKELNEVLLPKNTKIIGEGFFANSSLQAVQIPQGCIEIRECAFYNCALLPRISLPEGLKNIGEMAFAGCKALTSVTIPAGCRLGGKEIFKDSGVMWLNANQISESADYALAEMPELKSAEMNRAAEFTTGLFMDNPNLEIINSDLEYAPPYFAALSPKVKMGGHWKNLREIGEFAYAGNADVIILGENISYIGEYSFAGSRNLKGVEANAVGTNIPEVDETAFFGVDVSKVPLYVTGDSYDVWASHPIWGKFDIKPGESGINQLLAKDTETIKLIPLNGGVLIECEEGIGNFAVTRSDGAVLLKGRTPESSHYIDLSDIKGQVFIVTVQNNKGEKSLTMMR